MLDQKELNEAFYLFTFLTGFVGSTIYFIINYFNSIIIRKQITKHNIIASEEYDLETKKYKLECERIMHRDNVKKYRKSKLTKIKSLDPRDNYFDNRTIGISEKSFFDYLKKIYPLEIKKNIFVGDFEKPFQCDLAFIKDNIRINIEIDEP
ncbi:MAG: hypothetical protein IPJ86_10660 [Bacteroidetes bacterium]|nr:hypothetical protein [Bacteroidota bacterium]